jgi:hypothetical protein
MVTTVDAWPHPPHGSGRRSRGRSDRSRHGARPPPIIARQAWSQGRPPVVPPAYGTVKLAFVHHTENPNGYRAAEVPAMLLAIYQFHRFVRGWNDIGYNFVIDLFGRIWEARAGGIDRAVIGAQAGGYNAVSTGVAVLGTFMDTVPSNAALEALERLLAWKPQGNSLRARASIHSLPVMRTWRRSSAFTGSVRPAARSIQSLNTHRKVRSGSAIRPGVAEFAPPAPGGPPLARIRCHGSDCSRSVLRSRSVARQFPCSQRL